MFTLEESALLGLMLRVVGWTVVLLTVGTICFVLLRRPPARVSAGHWPARQVDAISEPTRP
jgi:hypothetical protein